MSWRKTIKSYFETFVAVALGDELDKFGPWNSQTTNGDTTETFGPLAVFFEYSIIGDGLEYLLQTNIQQAERIPVQVTLHIVFNEFNEDYQDLAYDYAEKITCQLAGRKHELIHGRILKVSEVEDTNHRAQYDYQISFGFQLKEVVFTSGSDILPDANPVTEDNPNPDTGRALKTQVNIGNNT